LHISIPLTLLCFNIISYFTWSQFITSLNPVRFQLLYLCVMWGDVKKRLHAF
jgi:hypothetical protein